MLPNALQPSATDHIPVLAEEVRELLDVRPGHTVVDATFGAGGHAALLAADLRGHGKLLAVDRDPAARAFFERFRRRTGVQARFLRGEFATVLGQLAANGMKADAILLDLGVSSMQIDQPERGFSYAVDAPLDMRMDSAADVSAAELVNDLPERELELIFRRYGEERFARSIARAIGRRRAVEPFERTGQLVETIKAAIPAPARFGEGHPAKRVFQALRIAVNDELGQLEEALPSALDMLRPGGRVAVISFHSLEDRIVKRFFRDESARVRLPTRLSGLRLRPPAAAPHRHSQGDPARTAGDRAESTRRVGATSGGGEGAVTSLAHESPAKSKTRGGSQGVRRRAGRRRLAGGVVWIVTIAILLAGVVAVNVAVLRLNLGLDAANRHRAELKADIAAAASKLASTKATGLAVSNAEQAGLVPADPATTTYATLPH